MKAMSKIWNGIGLFLLAAMVCVSLSGVVYSQGSAVSQGRRSGGTERQTQTDRTTSRQEAAIEKAQQIQAEAAPVIQAMGDQIKDLLTMVNEMRRPDPAKITVAEQTLKESGRFVRKFDSKIQCEFNLLDSWLKYFKNDIPGALMSASTAFKTDAENNDARITYAAMSILSGRRPAGVVAKREPAATNERGDRNGMDARRQMADQQRNRTRPGDIAEQLLTASPSTGNILQVDINALNLELFEQRVPAIQAQCVNSTSFAYTPGQSALCLFFWQAKAKNFAPVAAPMPGEPNQPGTNRSGTRTVTTRREMTMEGDSSASMARERGRSRTMDSRTAGMNEYGYGVTTSAYAGTGIRSTIESESAAFGQLFLAHFADPGLRFLGVNTDNAAARMEAVARMVQNPGPWAQVFASDPQSGLVQFAKVDAETPFMAITDQTGTIRYAGPVSGFLAPMVLGHFNGKRSTSTPGFPAPAVPILTAPKPAIPASPVISKPQSAAPAVSAPVASISSEDNEPTEEELIENPSLYEAAKKLEYAKTLFIPAGQKRFMTSKNGVETCREIFRRWPNTKYAEEARQLLRKIPPDEQKRYNITNEELGL